ncbi:hypothetical protein [Lonepinella sp. MS14436]|uniref:hypothetical protein n=1 Tax=Lonepinella sp. MS14436 TaxID=3003619 RepID=UPI0036D84EB9
MSGHCDIVTQRNEATASVHTDCLIKSRKEREKDRTFHCLLGRARETNETKKEARIIKDNKLSLPVVPIV